MFPMYPEYPTILVTNTVAMDMFRLVRDFPHIETSWGVAGIAFPGLDSFALITNIILPTSEEVSRSYSLTKIGGSRMAASVSWLQAQYPFIKPKANDPLSFYTDTEFVFFSKGHSHHTLGLCQQSGTDEQSTRESVMIDGLDMAIAPLANIVSSADPYVGVNHVGKFLSVSQHMKIQLRFYFYNKTMAAAKKMRPLLVTPILIDDANAPQIPLDAWHLNHSDEYLAQVAQLAAYGCKTKTVNKPNPTRSGLNLQIMIEHPSWSGVLLVIVPNTYPATRPELKVLDIGKPKGTRTALHEGNPYLKIGDVWSSGDALLDIVKKHEARGLL